MRKIGLVIPLALTASLSLLTACGGGAMSSSTTTTTTTVAPVTIAAAPIVPPSAAPLTATTTSGNSNGLTIGTAFPLNESTLVFTSNSVADFNSGQPATLTLVGVQTSSGISTSGAGPAVYNLQVTGLALGSDANLPRDGTSVTLSNGGKASLILGALNYTYLGVWQFTPAGAANQYLGTYITGYQTPAGSVPTAGTASYAGGSSSAPSGGTIGNVIVPNGIGGIGMAALAGQANVSVNFGSGAVSGSLTNMTATPTASGSAAMPWNSVNLTGTLSGAAVNGTTSTSAAPANAGGYGLSAAATGKFTGALYGPNGEELGAIWSLSEPTATNGKTAVGTLGVTKQ